MDKDSIKSLLESYRPQDANDPFFAEALRQVAADAELSAWFEEVQSFDAAVREKLRSIPVPSDVKRHILRGYRPEPSVDLPWQPWRWLIPASVAALLVVAVLAWGLIGGRPRAMSPLEAEAVAYSNTMPPLQFVCFDPAAVAHWINEQPNAREIGLQLPKPDPSLAMVMIGSSVTKWKGHPVVMICLQNDKRMAMLYVLSGDLAPQMKDGATETVQKADWVVRATKTSGQLHLLATKGSPRDLDFPMPF